MRRAVTLAVIGFALVLILRFPARWLGPLLPRAIHCQQLDGSVWSGTCSGLTSGVSALGDLSWDLQALQLLRARLELRLDLTNQGSYLRGFVARGFGGSLHGRDVALDLPLTSALISSLPAGAHARLQGTLQQFNWNGKYLDELQGELNIQDLFGSQGQAFGSYQVQFSSAAGGVVHDTGGPLALDATLQLTHDPGYLLQGRVAARPSASPELVDQLKYLGTADAAGRRPFSLSGTF